jgi:hypothetical protein
MTTMPKTATGTQRSTKEPSSRNEPICAATKGRRRPAKRTQLVACAEVVAFQAGLPRPGSRQSDPASAQLHGTSWEIRTLSGSVHKYKHVTMIT